MKPLAFTACVLTVAALGCYPEQPADSHAVNAWLVNTVTDTAVRNAIIRQRTLFPYHFTVDGATLNDLGRHDLAVLASHFAENPGQLNIRRGGVSGKLYKARVAGVLDDLATAGVARGRVRISDLPAPGEGMPSENVLIILRQEVEEAGAYQPPLVVMPGTGGQR